MADGQRNHIFCLVVGGGMSGITMAAQLLQTRVLDHGDFVIVDQNADWGGVWKTNVYPGAACDVPSHAYTMRYALKHDWTRKYAPRAEIQEYYASIAESHNLRQSTLFSTKVLTARWDESTLLWSILLLDRVTSEQTTWTANCIVNAGGQFSRPKTLDIPGKESFMGVQWHTANWRADVDLTGKRVAIIGTGPSTGQVAPRIQPLVEKLYIYQRSSTYVLPRNDGPIVWWKKVLFRWFRPALWIYHIWYWLSVESTKKMWFSGTKENKQMYDFAMSFLDTQVESPAVRRKLKPTAEFGCKRIMVLDDYLSVFNQPNVELVTDKPMRITEKGIVSKPADQLPERLLEKETIGSYSVENEAPGAREEEREIDVLIWGTGFEMDNQGGHFQCYGIDGINLAELWGDRPQAYYSVAVSKFPNMMLILGPNSANNWANLTTLVQVQATYNCKLIRRLKEENARDAFAMHPDPVVQLSWNNWIQKNLKGTVVLESSCSNYYTSKSGESSYWNPLHGYQYAWRMYWPRWNEFVEIRMPKLVAGGNDLQESAKDV